MKEQSTEESKLDPFEGIGLCFSGGGYRATFFSLGVVSYLERIQFKGSSLLDRTLAVSSVSGGTLLAVAYSRAVCSPEYDFKTFYREFYNQFKPDTDTLLSDAMKKLEDQSTWVKFAYKKQSIINAFALTYAEMDIFKGGFDVYKNTNNTQLKEVCFNSTEFSFGLPFRFQNSGIFGNSPLRSPNSEALKYSIQLGDIVASSSCFPLGFEPLIFPNDYFSDQSTEAFKALKKEEYFEDGIGIMDGGIADNQGIESMLNITRRKAMNNKFNLLIVNDVASYKMVPWSEDKTPIRNRKSLRTTFRSLLGYLKVKPIYWILLLAGVLLMLLNAGQVFSDQEYVWPYVTGGILTGMGIVLIVLGAILASVKKEGSDWLESMVKGNVPEVLLNDVISFQNLEIGLIKRMLTERLTSGAKMINDVFLKQIRRLNYNVLYNEENFDNKRITSTVYQLNGEKTPYGNNSFNKKITPTPSKELTKTALIASQTPTTLWWDEKDKEANRMDSLIACGQFTTCYNLLDYVTDIRSQGYDSSELQELENVLRADWKKFNEQPLNHVNP
ncbi:MAG: hypothetical protein Aureis2KO_11430 [Aureisphaera sp.]